MTVWDQLAKENRKKKDLEEIYMFWILFAKDNYKIVSLNERKRIYKWCQDTGGDNIGRIRGCIIRHLPKSEVLELIQKYEINVKNAPTILRNSLIQKIRRPIT